MDPAEKEKAYNNLPMSAGRQLCAAVKVLTEITEIEPEFLIGEEFGKSFHLQCYYVNKYMEALIGYTDLDEEGDWKWVYGIESDFKNWGLKFRRPATAKP